MQRRYSTIAVALALLIAGCSTPWSVTTFANKKIGTSVSGRTVAKEQVINSVAFLDVGCSNFGGEEVWIDVSPIPEPKVEVYLQIDDGPVFQQDWEIGEPSKKVPGDWDLMNLLWKNGEAGKDTDLIYQFARARELTFQFKTAGGIPHVLHFDLRRFGRAVFPALSRQCPTLLKPPQ